MLRIDDDNDIGRVYLALLSALNQTHCAFVACDSVEGCWFTSTETVGLLGTGAQDVHLDLHTAPELCM